MRPALDDIANWDVARIREEIAKLQITRAEILQEIDEITAQLADLSERPRFDSDPEVES
jgi:hypothetical protein